MIDKSRFVVCGVPLEREDLYPKRKHQQDLMFDENWNPTYSNQSHLRNFSGHAKCLCPICSGTPSEDPVFKALLKMEKIIMMHGTTSSDF